VDRERVIVTGATGFIGRALTRAWLADGATVTALVREKPGRQLGQGAPQGAEAVEVDLRYAAGVRRAVEAAQPTLVVHLAAVGVTDPFLLYVGSARPQKNLPRLIEAFAVLKGELRDHRTFGNLKLLIIGDELSEHPELRRSVIRTRMQDDVRFLGFVPVEILRVFYQAAEVFVFPSLHEGFGLPPLEAMALGTPVVTSNVSSLPEVVGDAAVLVAPENVFEIARGVQRALLDEELRSQLRLRGHQQIARFSWDRSIRQVLEIYSEAVA